MPFAASMKLEDLNTVHPYYGEKLRTWDEIARLYENDDCLKRDANWFLIKRPKEPNAVYDERLKAFSSSGVIPTIATYYESALFSKDMEVDGIPRGDEFWTGFLKDCDRAGHPLSEMAREILRSILLFNAAWVLTDLPKVEASNLAEQKAKGGLSPYLVQYDPRSVLNWGEDSHGNITWCTIAVDSFEHEDVFPHKARKVRTWTYYNHAEFARYRAVWDDDGKDPEDAVLVDSGPHAMVQAERPPVRRFRVADGYWIAKRIKLQAIRHLNIENALDWALYMQALAIMVIVGDFDEESAKVSETAYIRLNKGSDIKWTVPDTQAFDALSKRLHDVREDIYRGAFLLQQGRSTAATPAAMSGIAKEQDAKPAYEVAASYGDAIRCAIANLCEDVSFLQSGAAPSSPISVRGLNPDPTDVDSEIGLIERAMRLGTPSETFERYLHKRAISTVARDEPADLIQTMHDEVDAAPTAEERELEQLEARQQFMASAMTGGSQQPRRPVKQRPNKQ